jgi:succinoglycan biosynthesis transport protein ExoP
MDADKAEFSDYVDSLRRRRRLLLTIWVPIVLLTMLLAVGLPSEYGSTATFQLKTDLNDHARGDNYADRYISGLTGTVLGSPELRAALGSLAPYPTLKDDPGAALKKLQGDVRADMLTQKILDPQTGLERNINTGFTVTYVNRDPETAQKVSTWLANAFIVDGRRAAAEQVLTESRFYAAEADRQRAKIMESEARLARFKEQNFDRLPDTTQANLNIKGMTDQDLQGVERDLLAQQQNRTFVLQQLQQARAAGGNVDTLRALEAEYAKKAAVYDPNHPDMIALRQQIDAMRSGAATSGTGSDLEAQLAAQRASLAEMRQRYSEDYPDVKRLERSIQELQARVASGEKDSTTYVSRTPAVVQLETQLNGVETQIAALERQRGELREKEANLQSRLQSTPEVERAYDTLNRDAVTARQMYDQLNSKRMDADIRAAAIKIGTADQFTLLAPPLIPKSPTKPPRIGIAVIGVIAATFLALMVALGVSALDSSVRGSRDLVALLDLTPIAVVPLIRNAESMQRRRRRLTALTATTLVAVPLLYLLIHFAAR